MTSQPITQSTLQPRAGRHGQDWRDAAACRGADPELFYPASEVGPGRRQVEQAKQVCGRCLVREQCLEIALNRGEPFGVWGGTTASERRARTRRGARAHHAARRAGSADPGGGGDAPVLAEWRRAATIADKRRLARRAIDRHGHPRTVVAAAFGVCLRTVDRWIAAERAQSES
ncbi:WhiB family transcriptional regulator [Pseudonocardia parietis]|uniref:Transcriptional regulator WhiB n=1 Tax=Pseudonocardia parietis TaxID=570936 RepID=A0ABS4W6J0_9PSEU|nr:hypothetical protein [Pseudonocardia parietis]